VDTQTAIASKRDTRRYRPGDVPDDVLELILQAGRITGSGKNRQRRRFVVLRDRRPEASELVTRPSNVRDTPVTVAIVTAGSTAYTGFDAGRAAQNMMLAAWDMGIASCPNAMADPDAMRELVGVGEDEDVAILISFGHPASDKDPGRKTPEQWYAGADRVPLEDLVDRR
jgi:nitroreductase